MSLFELRLPGCPFCRASSSGDCGNHGPKGTVIKAQEVGDLGAGGEAHWQQPYKCPVCEGRQRVPETTYRAVPLGYPVGDVDCRTCKGEGVLWR